MASLPDRSILDGSGIPTNSAMKTAMGSLRDYLAGLLGADGAAATALTALGAAASGANTDITSLSGLTSINSGQLAGLRNRIINGNFGINQRAVSGTVVLAAGVYGHDRFKGGASGCTYTFSTSNNVTTITISAGSLQQVVEGLNLESGTYTLSWTGTAEGKIGAGSYGASGITGVIVGGTNTTVEFGPGTVSKVQFEFGSTATVFEHRPYGMELALCKRYGRKLTLDNLGFVLTTDNLYNGTVWFENEMRAAPTLDAGATFTANTGAAGTVNLNAATARSAYFNNTGTGWTVNAFIKVTCFLSAEL